MPIIILHNCVDPDDPKERTYKEINAEKTHAIPVGALVELEDGCRLWVVHHARDCDMTPLYCLCSDREDNVMHDPMRYNYNWDTGHSEEGLTLIKGPEDE